MDQPLQTVGASYRELAYMRHGWGSLFYSEVALALLKLAVAFA